jgi:hypothetical protein
LNGPLQVRHTVDIWFDDDDTRRRTHGFWWQFRLFVGRCLKKTIDRLHQSVRLNRLHDS